MQTMNKSEARQAVRDLVEACAANAAKLAGWYYAHPIWQRPATAEEIARYGLGDGLCHALTAKDACRHDNFAI